MKTIDVNDTLGSFCFVTLGDANRISESVIACRNQGEKQIQLDFTNIDILQTEYFSDFWHYIYKHDSDQQNELKQISKDEISVIGLTDVNEEKFYHYNETEFKLRKEYSKNM